MCVVYWKAGYKEYARQKYWNRPAPTRLINMINNKLTMDKKS